MNSDRQEPNFDTTAVPDDDRLSNDVPGAKEQDSPDFLAAPKRGKGVRRLNKRPLLVVGGLVGLTVLGLWYTLYQRQQAQIASASAPVEAPPVSAPPSAPVGPSGDSNLIEGPPAAPSEIVLGEPPVAGTTPTMQATPATPAVPSEAYQNRMDLIQRVEDRRLAQLEAALAADGSVAAFASGSGSQAGQAGQAGIVPASAAASPAEDMQRYLAGLQPGIGGTGGFGGGDDMAAANRQEQKQAFLAGSPEADTYLAAQRTSAIAISQELKAGTIIPGVLISGLNSDLPGQIIGQVRENVYDSATGTQLLIPAGSRLVGTYDSAVTLGQNRALVGWSRIIFPDASSISLDMMPGADLSGYAGFNDKVNNHYWRIFGNGLLLSVFSAGIQLSQPQSSGNTYDSQQIIAAELGRQMGQLGMEMTRRNMQIQPTLEIRPGYQFNVMVTKDIILPTWQGHPMAVGGQGAQ